MKKTKVENLWNVVMTTWSKGIAKEGQSERERERLNILITLLIFIIRIKIHIFCYLGRKRKMR